MPAKRALESWTVGRGIDMEQPESLHQVYESMENGARHITGPKEAVFWGWLGLALLNAAAAWQFGFSAAFVAWLGVQCLAIAFCKV